MCERNDSAETLDITKSRFDFVQLSFCVFSSRSITVGHGFNQCPSWHRLSWPQPFQVVGFKSKLIQLLNVKYKMAKKVIIKSYKSLKLHKDKGEEGKTQRTGRTRSPSPCWRQVLHPFSLSGMWRRPSGGTSLLVANGVMDYRDGEKKNKNTLMWNRASLLARRRQVKSRLAITRLHSEEEDSWQLDAPRLSLRLNSSHADEVHHFSSFWPAREVINSPPPSPPVDVFDVVRFEWKAISPQLTNERTRAVTFLGSFIELSRLQFCAQIYEQDVCNCG